jgi:hypothetical protein
MRVLVACEYSGIVRDAFNRRGHQAMSCDLLPTDKEGPHYQGDVFDVINDDWDLMIAHPPCTYLCNSGVRWLYKDGERVQSRWDELQTGARFFQDLLCFTGIPKICIENPIMHKYAKEIIGRGQTQIIQPWQFGHGETKATCLWLSGLDPLVPTNIVEGREARIHKIGPSADRWKIRSTTYEGIAEAMAQQWG